MAKLSNDLLNIYVHGSRHQIGYKLGALLQKYIKKSSSAAYNDLDSKQRKWLLSAWQITKEHFPQFIEEITGMSEGSKIPALKIFSAYCEELDEFSNGCTDIIAMPNATEHKETLIGHNNDELDSKPMIIRSKTPNGITSVGISLNGIGYSVAFNSAGLSLTGNHLPQKDIKEGVPRRVIFGEMTRAGSFKEAVKIASHPARASSYNNIIAEPKHIISLEGSGNHVEPIPIKKDVFSHANHYMTKLKRVEDKDKDILKDSKTRVHRANELLEKLHGKHTIKTFLDILADHKSTPHSICSHLESGADVETLFAVIVRLEARQLFYTSGHPCKGSWCKLKF